MADAGAALASTSETAGGDTQADGPAPTTFMKRNKNRGNVRKRAGEESEEVFDEPASVERKAKVQKDAPLAFSTRANDQGKAQAFRFESSRTLQQTGDQGATAVLETETAFDRDARALREQVLRQATDGGAQPDNTYRGMNNYVDYKQGFRREHTIGNEKSTGWHGPLRASAFVRTTARFDYQPDVCKDYKETGFCGYGDACKFVHDRSDYKSGWELEREWNEKEKQKAHESFAEEGAENEDGKADSDLPFACFICRRPWEEVDDPVVTRCRHYFCEQCALQHNAKSKKCFVCEQPTSGIFNVAKDLVKRVKDRKAAAL